jgi:hypothetical protein
MPSALGQGPVFERVTFCLLGWGFLRITPHSSMKAPLHSLFLRSCVAAEPAPSSSCELRSRRSSVRFAFASLAASLALFGTLPVSAQSKRPSNNVAPAVLLATAGGQASGSALDSVIGAALDELHVVNVVARPGMDLGAVQLALDCVAETAQCLRTVTTQNSADVLIAPSLSRTSGELVLTVLRFDARNGQMRRALRRQPGQSLNSTTLDAVPDMLRELFDLPPQPKAAATAPGAQPSGQQTDRAQSPTAAGAAAGEPGVDQEAPAAATEPLPEAPMEPPGQGRRVPVGPFLLGGGGLVIVGAGVVMGLVFNSSQKEYDSLTDPMRAPISRTDADLANSKASAAKTQAVVADVLFGLGGAALVGAGIWLAVELTRRPDQNYEHVQISPLLGPNQLGLMLTQRGAGL